MMFFKKHIIEISLIVMVVLLISAPFLLRDEAKKEVHQLSKNAQVVRDYLDGKEVRGNEAWWLHLDSGSYSIAAHVAMELELNEQYVFSQLQSNNYVLVHRPKTAPAKELEKK